jgi:murein DD-endopeptidase MepM/ murein hydrolase activator NlpD
LKANKLYHELHKRWKQNDQVLQTIQTEMTQLEDDNELQQKELQKWIQQAVTKAQMHEKKDDDFQLLNGNLRLLQWPVANAPLTSPFGNRWDPILHQNRLHKGIDIGGKLGAPIRAAAMGEVIEARPSSSFGYVIILYHGSGLSTLYAHMYAQTVKVRKGQQVQAGQIIAAVGSNGWSTGPHLHFEVHKHGKPVDPMNYLK